MVTIRLTRMGSKKRPFFRVVVVESARARDGRFVENLGYYNPRTQAGDRRDRSRAAGALGGQGRAAVGHGAHADRAHPAAPAARRRRPAAGGVVSDDAAQAGRWRARRRGRRPRAGRRARRVSVTESEHRGMTLVELNMAPGDSAASSAGRAARRRRCARWCAGRGERPASRRRSNSASDGSQAGRARGSARSADVAGRSGPGRADRAAARPARRRRGRARRPTSLDERFAPGATLTTVGRADAGRLDGAAVADGPRSTSGRWIVGFEGVESIDDGRAAARAGAVDSGATRRGARAGRVLRARSGRLPGRDPTAGRAGRAVGAVSASRLRGSVAAGDRRAAGRGAGAARRRHLPGDRPGGPADRRSIRRRGCWS